MEEGVSGGNERFEVLSFKEALDTDFMPSYPAPIFSELREYFATRAFRAIFDKIDNLDDEELGSAMGKVCAVGKMELTLSFYRAAMRLGLVQSSKIESFNDTRVDTYAESLVDLYGLQRACSYLPAELQHQKAADMAGDRGMTHLQEIIERSLKPVIK